MSGISTEYLKSEIITVLIGSNHERYFLHKDVLCNNSRYFKACLQPNNFSEGRFKVVDLKDVDNQVFRSIVRFLYHNDIGDLNDIVSDGIKAYMLADKLLMHKCKNHIIDKLRARMYPKLKLSTLMSIKRAHMLPKMALTEFLTDQLAFHMFSNPGGYLATGGHDWEEEGFASQLDCAELFQQVFRKVINLHARKNRGVGVTNPSKRPGWVYHEDEEGKRCKEPSTIVLT